jgi:hypothetical protein
MNAIRPRILMLVAGLLLSGAGARGDEEPAAEPLELTRLRQQFQHRLDQELAPWREKYRKELQKLEDRMIAERKLVEALAVKKEREASAPLSTEPEAAGAPSKVPNSMTDAHELLVGSVWLVYRKDDKSRGNLIDTYQFLDKEKVLLLSTKRTFPWSLLSTSEVSVQSLAGTIDMEFNFSKWTSEARYQGVDYIMIFAGRPASMPK